MTALEQFGSWVASGGGALRGHVPPGVHPALRVADAVGAWIAGRATVEGRVIAALRADDLPARVARHCACARLSEIDDIHLASATTPGGVIVPAAITVAASVGADRAALVRAVDAGYEAMARLGRAIDGPAVLYRGIWPTCFAAPFGVAAVCARLLGLDAMRAAQALGIALALASPGARGAARWLALGNAAANGVRAAMAARDGLTSDLGMLEGEFLSGVYGIRPDTAMLTGHLGQMSAITETSVKPWCAARQTMAAAQGWIELFGEGAMPAGVREIRVAVPPPCLKMVNHGVTAGERLSHLTSIPYQVALAALAPESRHDVQQTPATIAPALRGFMEKVKVEADESLMTHYPAAWPARVAVDGRETLVLHVPGDPQRPWTEADVLAKFERYAPAALGRAILAGAVAPADLLERACR